MSTVNLITPPDKIFNKNVSILLIYPNEDIQNKIQDVIRDIDIPLNVYVYNLEETEHNLDWLLSVAKFCKYVIFNIDNSEQDVRNLASYIISEPNCYWLTNETSPVYSLLSPHRVYDLSFLKLGESLEKTPT